MSIYLYKLAHVQVVINCRYSVTQMCTCEDTLAHNLGAPYIDYVLSYNSLTTHFWAQLCIEENDPKIQMNTFNSA